MRLWKARSCGLAWRHPTVRRGAAVLGGTRSRDDVVRPVGSRWGRHRLYL
jgi:hypothetical protein